MLFREHRGGYEEAMKTTIELGDSIDDLKLHIKKIFLRCDLYKDDADKIANSISVRHYGFDHRNGWETYIVKSDYGVEGWTNKMPVDLRGNE